MLREHKLYFVAVQNASRPELQKTIDEFSPVCGYNQKYEIKPLKKKSM